MDSARTVPTGRDLPLLDLPNVLWFFGAITAMVASIAILDKVPESGRDTWLLLASLGFLVAYALASVLLYRRGLWILAGLMATVSATCSTAMGTAGLRAPGWRWCSSGRSSCWGAPCCAV